jgi:hypothetical protein
VAGPIPNSIWSSTASGSAAPGAAEIATIAIMPAGLPADGSAGAAAKHAGAARSLALALKECLGGYGPVLQLNSSNMRSRFPVAFDRLHVLFYRSKVTSWMAAQEEEYRCGGGRWGDLVGEWGARGGWVWAGRAGRCRGPAWRMPGAWLGSLPGAAAA